MMTRPPVGLGSSRAGFTLVEMLIVLVMTSLITAMTAARFRDALSTARLARASRAVASDVGVGVSLAVRQGRPVRIECDCANRVLRIVDRATGQVLHQRSFNGAQDLLTADLDLQATDGNPWIIVYPNGLPSAALTIAVMDGLRSRTVVLTAAGAVHVS